MKMVTLTPPEGPEEFTCFLSLGGPFEPGYVCIDSDKSEFLAFMSSGRKIMHVPVHDIEDIREDWTLPSSLKLTVTLRSSKELIITHLLNKERLQKIIFKIMGERQESSGSTESSPSPCTPDKDQSGMDGESSATEDLKSPPGSPKAKPDHMLFQQPPLINSETEEHSLFEKRTTILDEGTTDLKLAQLHEMFPGVDIKDFSELLKAFGGDVNSVVDAMLSKLHLATPDAAQVKKFECKEFFQKYEDKFLGSVNTHAIAKLLAIKKVIPGDLCFELEKTGNDKATEILFLHMRDHGLLETVHSLCDVMIGKEGYPKMNSLGQDMQEDLPILNSEKLEGEPPEKKKIVIDENLVFASHALQDAAYSGSVDIIETVVRNHENIPGFDIDCLATSGLTPLHTASMRGHVGAVAKLVELRCDINKVSRNGLTALHYAAGNGQVDVVAKLIKLGCDMNKADNNGRTALHYAAKEGRVDVVAKLVELGCDMNKTENNGFTALHIAAVYGYVDIVASLVHLGVDPNQTDRDNKSTALHFVAELGRVDVIVRLIQLGCDVDRTNSTGWTALHFAAKKGNVDVVSKLIDFQCDKDRQVLNGGSALHVAAEAGHVDVVARLIELGCDMNKTDLLKCTALHMAAANGHVPVVTKLIELGCDTSKTNNYGATALHMAAGHGHPDVIAELVLLGMDLDETTTEGTALHLAAAHGHVNVVTKLIELGCDRNKTNTQGQTALDIAKAAGHIDIIAKLICQQGE